MAYYNIISAPDVIQLEEKVNNSLKTGFRPTGGVTVWQVEGQHVLLQAVVFDKEEG